ncbi:MAG: diacylglycerol kinase family protein [Bacteroidota bacterium]|nr:diacylglycerol kinase family protein [Bacteroidota bacterium]
MKVYFIVKPLGGYKLKQLRKSLEKTFDNKKDTFYIFSSMKKGHSIALTEKAIDEKADVVVACGGDGTINEVAQGLVETQIPLGIIPLGSGNGIARHFKIPLEISKSVLVIKKNKLAKMDVGVVNGHYFFGNMGCALESHFIRSYQKNERHGIWAYVIAFFDALISFKHQKIQVEYLDNVREISPFILLVSNANQQGYDFSLTPQAESDDGLLDLFWMEKSNVFNKIKFFLYALLKKKLMGKRFDLISLSTLKIRLLDQDDFCVQIDGENLPIFSNYIEIKVLPKKLNVIVP